MKLLSLLFVCLMVGLVACQPAPDSDSGVVRIDPGPNAQEEIQTALLVAEPGSVIELGEGRFDFDGSLSLDVKNVTLRGVGRDKTILDFSRQEAGTGGEGILATSDGFTIESLSVENTRGDAIKVEGATGVVFRNVRVDWAGEPKTENGAYGIYPVQCTDVLIEDSEVRGASDAGIYVGQSRNIIVRRNKVWQNVAGIEIENSFGADVYDNEATDNTGGILVFSLPELPVKNGRDSRIFRNRIHANNHENFGYAGAIISSLPSGTGLQIMANGNTEIFENTISDNQTYNIAILSYLITGRDYDDPEYDPYAEGIYVHDNVFEGGGDNPQGRGHDLAQQFGGTFPDIVYDGFVDPAKLVDGKVLAEFGIYIENNGDADFVNLDLGAMLDGGSPEPQQDVLVHAGQLPTPPEEIVLSGAL